MYRYMQKTILFSFVKLYIDMFVMIIGILS